MSGSTVAYHLRVNKYVDRRLFVEALEFVARYQAVRDMGYVSMGGGYLEDFRVMHQSLGLKRMLTFDMEDWVVRRQMVNKPYGFVECEVASSGEILDKFDDIRKRLVGPSGNVIFWLDYSMPAKRHEQLADLQQLASVLIHGDVFRITLNASRSSYGTNDQYQIVKKAGNTDKATLHEWWQDKMADQLKEYLAEERNSPELLETEAEFARTLLWAVKKAALQGLYSRPELTVVPLLAVHYSDGQGMLTFAGLVLEADCRDEFRQRTRWEEWPYNPGQLWDDFVELDVPFLSLRERQIVHGKMDGTIETVYSAFFAYLLGFQFDGNLKTHEQLVAQYLNHHRRYPTFALSDIL